MLPVNVRAKIIAWEYRWQDRGLTRSRSTGTKDLAIAEKIQKKWDAAVTLNGPAALEEKATCDLTIESQVKLYLDNKAAEIRQSTLTRYRQQIEHVLEFFRKLKIRFFDELNSSLMKQYKIARTDVGAAPKTVFEELALLRAIIRSLVEEEAIDADSIRVWPKIKKIPAKPETLDCYSNEEMSARLTTSRRLTWNFMTFSCSRHIAVVVLAKLNYRWLQISTWPREQ
ncbi:MAG: hypothetical protein GQF41_1622 [Candidatus Rifleibacterium amylolyticum]|nr:MAG: hypothetical protein GQF41_1622 [Candidatus Rifleibacterium amylolyticum]